MGGLGPHPQEKTHQIRKICQIATPLRGMEVDLHAILISAMSSYVFCQPYPLEKISTVIIIAQYFVISSIVFISVSTTFCTNVVYVNNLVSCLGISCVINNCTFTVKHISCSIYRRLYLRSNRIIMTFCVIHDLWVHAQKAKYMQYLSCLNFNFFRNYV
jgi:hypothetical protein